MSLLLGLVLCGAFEFNLPGSNSAMLAGVAVPTASNAFTLNPALLSDLPASSVQFSHAALYDISELQYNRLGFGLRSIALGGSISLLSFAGYQELTAALTKSFSLPAGFAAGIQAGLYSLRVPAQGNQLVPGLDCGLAWHGPSLGFGAAVQDLNLPALRSGDAIPVRLELGAGATPVPKLTLAADCEYSAPAWRFRFSTGYDVHSALFLSAGMATNPLEYAVGATCRYRSVSISYVYLFSPRLKETQVLGIGFSF